MKLDIEMMIEERNKEDERESNLDKMYKKVTVASSREDIENSIRVKLDSIEKIFAEVLTLPTAKFKFQEVL
jgi:hypothetical protein